MWVKKFYGRLLVMASLLFGWLALAQLTTTPVAAADLTYTQPFQNQTTSLSGTSVSANTYFIKVDYWHVKKATFNFNFQLSQLADDQLSDITLSLNGVKFYSFRPEKKTSLQEKQVEIPLRLLSGSNELRINGQILNQAGANDYRLAQTPANWLTIDQASNVNFEYTLQEPDHYLASFYDHFVGPDTIANAQSAILTPDKPTNSELTAAVYGLSGISRVITTEQQLIPVGQLSDQKLNQRPFQIIVAKYNHLPTKYQHQISAADVADQAVIKYVKSADQHILIVTAKTDALLIKASKFLANQELMKQSRQPVEHIQQDTRTFTSVLQYDGSFQLTQAGQRVTGAGHQEATFMVTLPIDRTNADGSTINLDLQYAHNLDFKRSLVTVYVNNSPIGSRRLSAKQADQAKLTFKLPTDKALGNTFVIRIAFDLELPGDKISDNTNVAWANVLPDSQAKIRSQINYDLLFSNYPSYFLKNSAYNNIAIVRPKKMTKTYFKTLTNIFNLLGCYAQNNTGTIHFYTTTPAKSVQQNQNIIAFGTPHDNQYLRQLNSQLFFQYDQSYQRFISNEKLSIERDFGKQMGTAQLLRSQANDKLGILALTGPTELGVYLASTQINYQRNIEQYSGDAIVVDQDNQHYSYRFKKQANTAEKTSVAKKMQENSHLLIYLGLALLVILVIGITLFLLLRKHGLAGGGKHES